MDEESDVVRCVLGNSNLPYICLIGHKGMSLHAYVRLPAMFQAPLSAQKVKYFGLPNQCFIFNRIGHVDMNKLFKSDFLTILMMKA